MLGVSAWRPIPGYPGYEVAASGRVRRADTGYVLAPHKGYVALCRDGQVSRCAVRQLAASAWAETPAGRPQAAPAASADILELAGEYDCLGEAHDSLVEENTGLYADCAKFQETVGLLEDRAGRMKRELTALRTENEIRQRTNNRLEETNDLLSAQIAELKTRPATQPAAVVLLADEKDAEIARLRGVVAELEAELALYRASAGL